MCKGKHKELKKHEQLNISSSEPVAELTSKSLNRY